MTLINSNIVKPLQVTNLKSDNKVKISIKEPVVEKTQDDNNTSNESETFQVTALDAAATYNKAVIKSTIEEDHKSEPQTQYAQFRGKRGQSLDDYVKELLFLGIEFSRGDTIIIPGIIFDDKYIYDPNLGWSKQ